MEEHDILSPYQKVAKETLTEIYQFKMDKTMKKKIFSILKERKLSLSVILRSYIEKIINQYEKS